MNLSIKTLAFSTLIGLGCAACSSKLVIKNDATSGIPFPTAVAYVEFFAKDKHSKGGKCDAVLSLRHLSLPGDTKTYVNIEADTFAKAGLVVKYSERGLVSELAFNTEPSADAIEAATGAATALLPFLGVLPATRTVAPPAPAGAAAVPADAAPEVACDAGDVPLRLIPLATYLDAAALEAIVTELRNDIAQW